LTEALQTTGGRISSEKLSKIRQLAVRSPESVPDGQTNAIARALHAAHEQRVNAKLTACDLQILS
jgi:hypothetical protein